MTGRVRRLSLVGDGLCVLLRYVEINGRWLASADTPVGPSLGCGWTPLAAVWRALSPYEVSMDLLMADLPDGVMRDRGARGSSRTL